MPLHAYKRHALHRWLPGAAEPLRLRILNLLGEGPLCVCHLVEILGAGQVRMSKQLAYLKRLGLVESERRAQWMIYRLAGPAEALVRMNLRWLKRRGGGESTLAEDLRRRAGVLKRLRTECSGVSGALMTVTRRRRATVG